VLPTTLDALGIRGAPHRIEGRSLLPLTRGDMAAAPRDAVFSELDYGFRRARLVLGRGVRECRGFMVRTLDWKYVHWEGFRPQLFDLDAGPRELTDLGADPRYDGVRACLRERLFDWIATQKRRTTLTDEAVAEATDAHRAHGIHIGIW
jgi:arylsulfatase A-like enzyme